jgi:serine/threonine protein kinase/tetratricopeptide (TPR) repeat protein
MQARRNDAMELGSQDWSRVKTLFQSMIEMDAASRRRFLDAQALSPELASALDELLHAHDEAGSFLDPKVLHASALVNGPSAGLIAVGTVLANRFKVLLFRARGGMGEVYEAEDLELHMPVAIKVIRPEIADLPGVLNRFRREVHLAKQVTHPNVCRIFDIFHHNKEGVDVLFLTMELLQGETLSERLQRAGKLCESDAIVILHQLASALEAAHAAGILHRDLKPGNIILEAGRQGTVRAVITDFGMALRGDTRSSMTWTASGQVAFGTPEYMSPEQFEGKDLSAASDVYALGLVAYQMLTGVRAFDAETPLYAALRRLTESPPTPRRSRPELSVGWDALIVRSLERNPAKRLASAAEFDAALQAIEQVHPRQSGLSRWRAGMSARIARHRRMASVLGILAGLLSVGGVVGIRRLHRKAADAKELTVVLADFVNTTGEPAFDHSLNVALAAKLQQTPYLTLMPEQKIRSALQYMGMPARQHLTEQVALQVCQREAGQVVLQGFIANNAKGYTVGLRAIQCATGKQIASRQTPVEFRDSVLEALDRTTEEMRPMLGEPHESIRKYDVPLVEATTPSFEAVTAFAQGTEVWNERGEAAALPYFQRATEIDPNFAMAYARLGTVYGNMGETQRADEAMRQAFDRRDRVTEWERYYIVSHYYGFVTGQIDKEMETYEEWAKAYPHDMAWTINLSVDYAFTGRYDKAIDLQRRAIREIPGLSPSYGNLAQYFLAVEKPDEARAVLDQATQLNLHDVNIQLDEYELAFYLEDAASISRLLAGAAQFPGVEDTLLAQQAATEDRAGRLDAGAEYAAKAGAVALHSGAPETSAMWLAEEAVRQAELGRPAVARRLIAQATANPKAARGSDVQVLTALAAAQAGEAGLAQALLRAVSAERPLDTLIQFYWVPILRAHIAYAQGNHAQALEDLKGTDLYDLGIFTPGQCMDAAFVRGEALLAEHQPQPAAEAFRQILGHRGLVLNCPTSALAQLGLARALAQAHDVAASRTAYQDLLALWKDAEPGFRLRQEAESEYRSLH